jgi:hypothetical protein
VLYLDTRRVGALLTGGSSRSAIGNGGLKLRRRTGQVIRQRRRR